MNHRLDLFGAIHVDRLSKVERELSVFAENTDADAIFVEWPAEDISWQTVLRNLLRPVDFLLFYVVGVVLLFLTDRRQRLGDLVAGTEVRPR